MLSPMGPHRRSRTPRLLSGVVFEFRLRFVLEKFAFRRHVQCSQVSQVARRWPSGAWINRPADPGGVRAGVKMPTQRLIRFDSGTSNQGGDAMPFQQQPSLMK
jgi:hypothetical protein